MVTRYKKMEVGEKYLTVRKMEVGEKYLTVRILGNIQLNAFPNKEGKDKNPQAPDFKGEGIAVWVNKKKELKSEVVIQDVL